jgi:PIN domain nuclease of toxin-antitoxin system
VSAATTHVVDTHALVWFLEADSQLSQPARTALQDPAAHLVIPTIVLAEITFLYA